MFGRKDNTVFIDKPLDGSGRRSMTPLQNVHDFGCQLIDDAKNGGFDEGVVISVTKNTLNKWVARAVGNFKSDASASLAMEEVKKLIRTQLTDFKVDHE